MIRRFAVVCIWAMLLVVLAWPARAEAPPRIALDAAQSSLELNGRMAMLIDADATMTAEQVEAADSSRFRIPGEWENNWYTSAAQWRAIDLFNPDATDQERFLEVKQPFLSYVDVYVGGAGQNFRHFAAGSRRPFTLRPLPYRSFVFPVAVPAGATARVLLRIQTGGPLLVEPTLWTHDAFLRHASLEAAAQAAMHGMAIMIIALTLAAWLIGRSRAVLWLVIHMAFYELRLLVGDGTLQELLGGGATLTLNDLMGASVGGTLASVVIFVDRALDLRAKFPRLARAYLLFAPLCAVLAVPALFGAYALTALPLNALSVPLVLATIALMVACYRRGEPAALPMLLGTALASFSVLARFGVYAGLPIPASVADWTLQIGFVAYAIMLALALAQRYRSAEAARAADARDLLLLTERREQELAQQVYRRTRELERLNRALAAYSRSLSAVLRTDDFSDRMARICAGIVEDSSYVLACVGLPEDVPGRPVRFVAGAGSALGYLDHLQVSWAEDVPQGRGPTGYALRDGTPHVVQDTFVDPDYSHWRALGAQFGIRSCVTVPSRYGERNVGVLIVYAAEPNAFGDEKLALFQRLSDEIGIAICMEENRSRLQTAESARAAAEARLEALVQDGPGVLFQDQRGPDGVWQRVYVSPNVTILTGYRHSCCVGPMPAAMGAADPAGLADWNAAVEQALMVGQASCDFQVRHADGHDIWLRAALKARQQSGGASLLTGYAVDITRERELTEALEAARRDLEDAIESGPGWLYRLTMAPDGSYRTEYVSHNIERATGYTPAEASAPEWLEQVVDPSAIPIVIEGIARLMREGRVATEYRMRTKSGDWIWIGNTLSATHRPDGRIQVIGYASDITQLKERTAQLQQASRLAVLGEMASGMAHELRQPLTAIALAAENADIGIERGDADYLRARLLRIQQQTERASNIIEHLRQFARGADATAASVPLALDAVVDGVMALVGETLRLEGISVSVALGDPPLSVLGQQMPLEQMLLNLLLNARDALVAHGPASGRHIRIAAEPVAGEPRVRLTVSDNGGGIPDNVLPRLFQPFVTTKLADKGTGLGLSICHGIVNSLGGEITAHNDAEGAVFTITLPAAA